LQNKVDRGSCGLGPCRRARLVLGTGVEFQGPAPL